MARLNITLDIDLQNILYPRMHQKILYDVLLGSHYIIQIYACQGRVQFDSYRHQPIPPCIGPHHC